MGEYFEAVCHTCRVRYRMGSAWKLREIALNVRWAAEVGFFATQHPGHRIELRGDEYNYDGGERVDDYAVIREVDDDDVRQAVARYEEIRAAARSAGATMDDLPRRVTPTAWRPGICVKLSIDHPGGGGANVWEDYESRIGEDGRFEVRSDRGGVYRAASLDAAILIALSDRVTERLPDAR